jgi:hypothetical protein
LYNIYTIYSNNQSQLIFTEQGPVGVARRP